MLSKAIIAVGLAASVAHAAPMPLNRDMQLLHTVTVETLPTDIPEGDAVGYAPIIESVVIEAATTLIDEPTATFESVTETEVEETETATESATPTKTATETATATAEASPSVSQPAGPVAPVVPVNICTNDGTNCLTTLGSEFADVKLSWDNIAKFNLGLDGLLVRLDDLKCVDAVPMDDATWYDLAFVDCTLPTYLQGAVALDGNGITVAPEATDDVTATEEALEPTATGMDRKAKLTAAPEATSTETPEETGATTEDVTSEAVETHTIWFYNSTTKYLCANVNDGLNDIAKVCIFSDEGYAMLGTEEELEDVDHEAREISMPVALSDDTTIAEHLLMMIEAMTFDGEVFWANAWDTNIVSVMKYRMMSQQSEEIHMDRDQMNGVIYPLWQVINDCRSACDSYAWCHSFTFPITERVCRLSDTMPVINQNEIDYKNPDVVTFVQNGNYNREDFVLPESIQGQEFVEEEQQ